MMQMQEVHGVGAMRGHISGAACDLARLARELAPRATCTSDIQDLEEIEMRLSRLMEGF